MKITNDLEQDVTANAIVKTDFTFTNREYDSETGFYYYRARIYDPSIGRFLQEDPFPGSLALPTTFLSKYIYANNSPLNYTDPSGLFSIKGVLEVGGMAAVGGILLGGPGALLLGVTAFYSSNEFTDGEKLAVTYAAIAVAAAYTGGAAGGAAFGGAGGGFLGILAGAAAGGAVGAASGYLMGGLSGIAMGGDWDEGAARGTSIGLAAGLTAGAFAGIGGINGVTNKIAYGETLGAQSGSALMNGALWSGGLHLANYGLMDGDLNTVQMTAIGMMFGVGPFGI